MILQDFTRSSLGRDTKAEMGAKGAKEAVVPLFDMLEGRRMMTWAGFCMIRGDILVKWISCVALFYYLLCVIVALVEVYAYLIIKRISARSETHSDANDLARRSMIPVLKHDSLVKERIEQKKACMH